MSSLKMKFSQYQAFLIFAALAPISPLEIEKIADGLDNIFLKGNVTAEESNFILADARESYQMLMDYNNETDPEKKKVLLVKMKLFTSQVIDDLARTDMSLRQLFRNINAYLKVGIGRSGEDGEPHSLTAAIPIILGMLDQRIAQHYSKPLATRYDVKRILSLQDGSMDNIFRGNESITPTTIGFFFLEAFATIFGLSWGIISMILSDFQ